VKMDISNVPTRDEMKTGFELIPHHNYATDMDFYIESNDGNRMTLIKYRSNGDLDAGGTNYTFWSTDMMRTGQYSIGGFKAPRVAIRLTGSWGPLHLVDDAWTTVDFDGGSRGFLTQERRIAGNTSGEFTVPENGTYVIRIGIQAEMQDNHGIEIMPMIDGSEYSPKPIILWAGVTRGSGIKEVGSVYWDSQLNLSKDQKVTFAIRSNIKSTHTVTLERVTFSLTQD